MNQSGAKNSSNFLLSKTDILAFGFKFPIYFWHLLDSKQPRRNQLYLPGVVSGQVTRDKRSAKIESEVK